MILHFNKKAINKQFLFFGFLWIVYGIYLTIDSYVNSNFKWHEITFTIIGIVYLIMYFWNKFKGYATITEKFIKKNDIIGRKVMLSDITACRKFAGEYNFKNSGKDLTIAPEILDEKSKELFFKYLEKHQIEII